MQTIEETIHSYYEFLCAKYGSEHILGVFLYGSQNYGIATEESDIDAKAIYIPSLLEIGGNQRPISKELIWEETGAHIEVKDIRLMTEMWRKMNINFLEILFTRFYEINPRYHRVWIDVLSKKEDIAFYNRYLAIKSACIQAYNTLSRYEDVVTSKQLVNGLRLWKYVEKYIENNNYKDCIEVPRALRDAMRREKLKKQEYNPKDNATIQQILKRLEGFNTYANENRDTLDIRNSDIDNFLATWCASAILMASPVRISID